MMLEDYKEIQPIAYKILTNSVSKGHISHAYLIETNEYPKKMEFAIAFAKFLLCKNHQTFHQNCQECRLCERIDHGNFTELKIIEPDGLWIKKEQLEELQQEFSKKSIESENKIYIINGAEKMNLSAANSILKFLEEPESGIIAILLTDNIYQLLDTIISRCQIVSLKKSIDDFSYEKISYESQMLFNIAKLYAVNIDELNSLLEDTQYKIMIESAVKFVNIYEEKQKNILIEMNQLWNSVFQDKEKIMFGLDIIVLYYKDMLNIKLNRPLEIFGELNNTLITLANKNTVYQICDKIKIVMASKHKIKYNMNQNLLMDKLVLELEAVSNGESCKS